MIRFFIIEKPVLPLVIVPAFLSFLFKHSSSKKYQYQSRSCLYSSCFLLQSFLFATCYKLETFYLLLSAIYYRLLVCYMLQTSCLLSCFTCDHQSMINIVTCFSFLATSFLFLLVFLLSCLFILVTYVLFLAS